MKNIAKYLFALSAAAFTFAACEKETEVKPGDPEVDGCYGVYFPVQEASGDHIYNPIQDKVLEITVARTNTEGAITVPVTASFTDPDGPTDVFTASDIVFADGQAETTFTVNFANAEDGVKYAGHFVIEDNQYASIYSKNSIGLDFTVMCVEMLDFKTEDGSKIANLTFTDDNFWGEVHDEITIEYYEVDGIRYCTTKGGKLLAPADGTEGLGPWGTNVQLSFKWYVNKTVTINDAEYQWIEVAPNYIGYDSSNGPVYMGDYYWMRADMGLSNGDYASSYDRYTKGSDGYLPSYYDGHGGFIFNAAYWIHGTTSWYGYKDNTPVAISEGYTRVDYSLKVAQTGISKDSEVPVSFEMGADVAKVYYEFKEGVLSNIQITNALAEMDLKQAAYLTESGVYNFNLGKTGEYTLIAQAVDDKDNVQNSASVAIVYLNADDAEEYAVQVSGGLASAEKYVPKGVNPDNSLEFFIYGSDLEQVKMGVYSVIEMTDPDACVADLLDSDDLDAAALEAINGNGYVDVITGLVPGTEFYMLVYANNGYAETVEVFGPATTSGDPLPVYQSFTVADKDPNYIADTYEGYVGTWNYYGINLDGTLGLREYLGKVTITKSETPDAPYEGSDSNTYAEQYLNVKGLSAGGIALAKAYGYSTTDDDTFEFCYDTADQILYVNSYWAPGYNKDTYSDGPYYMQLYASAAGSWYRANYFMAAIPVLDGYFAFVDVSGQGYEFNGWRFLAGGYYWTAFGQPLLVNPTKDDNGLASSPALKSHVDRAAGMYAEAIAENDNLVLTREARSNAIKASYAEKMLHGSYGHAMGLKGLVCPTATAKVVSVKYVGAPVKIEKAERVLETL